MSAQCQLQTFSKCSNAEKDNHHNSGRRNSKLNDWVNINSVPRKIHDTTLHSLCTTEEYRFAKKVPMTKSDWKKFDEWVKIRGTPKRSFGGYDDEKKSKSNKSPSMARLNVLSLPKIRNEKYEPKTEVFTFEPNIQRRHIPENRRRQPPDYKVSKTFQHPDIESKFWREFKFPVSQQALSYQADERIKKLSEPRVIPTKQDNKIYKTHINRPHAMSVSKWRKFKEKLQYLAKPKKNYEEKPKKVPRGRKVPLSELQPRINSLSVSPQSFRYDEYYSSPQTLKSKRSPKKFQRWLSNLAKPRKHPILEEPRKLGVVSETALKAHASKRLRCLALPKNKYPSAEERAKTREKLKKYMTEILMGSNYDRCMRKKCNKKIFQNNEEQERIGQMTRTSQYNENT